MCGLLQPVILFAQVYVFPLVFWQQHFSGPPQSGLQGLTTGTHWPVLLLQLNPVPQHEASLAQSNVCEHVPVELQTSSVHTSVSAQSELSGR
jgi:hypothetical protein